MDLFGAAMGMDPGMLTKLGTAALQGPNMPPLPPTTNVNGDLNFNTSGWTVATGKGTATATLLPDWKVMAAVALAGLLVWKTSKKT